MTDSNFPVAIMLHKAQVKKNFARLNRLIPHTKRPEVIFSTEKSQARALAQASCIESRLVTKRADIARRTLLQSVSPGGTTKVRISASSQAHRIKIRKTYFYTLAQDTATLRQLPSAACAYTWRANWQPEKSTKHHRNAR